MPYNSLHFTGPRKNATTTPEPRRSFLPPRRPPLERQDPIFLLRYGNSSPEAATWTSSLVRAAAANSSSSSAAAAAAASSMSSSSSILMNYPLASALVAFLISQFTKLFFSWYKERRLDLRQIVAAGGMPSSHSATVTALAVATGFQEGLGGSQFAIALILACVVMYDATGVRLHAGRQAEVLNQIVYGLPAEHPLAESRPLRELLGHTPPQVIAGGLLGIVTAAVGHLIIVTCS